MDRAVTFAKPVSDERRQIQEEESDFQKRLSALKKQIQKTDEEFETLKDAYQSQLETLARRKQTLSSHIELLDKAKTTLVDEEMQLQNDSLANETDVLKGQIEDLERNAKILRTAINNSESEIQELNDLVASVPSDNPEILNITQRVIERRIQSQVFEVQLQANESSEALSQMEEEVQLARVVVSGLRTENKQTEERIQRLKKQLGVLVQERSSLVNQIQEAADQMPLSTLNDKIRESEAKLKSELRTLASQYRKRVFDLAQDIDRLTEENDNSRNNIEVLNSKVQQLTAQTIETMGAGEREIDKLKKRNASELEDIEERFRMQLETALKDQRNRFLESIASKP